MKKFRILVAVIMLFAIGFSLPACKKKVNLQTEAEAIKYLENYVQENGKWKEIAKELGLSSSAASSGRFESSSFATRKNDEWTVVLHGAMPGSAFSYMALVTTDGQVTKIGIVEGFVNNVYES